MFTISIMIGDSKFDKAMLDLGASINVIPSSIYESLALGPLLKTEIVIQLADGSYVHPKRMVEDVLIKIDKLIFPTDFFVLDMNENAEGPIMLGRPFMKTSRTKIDVFNGILTMEFDGDTIEHNIHDINSITLPSVCWINAVIPPDKENHKIDIVDKVVEPPDRPPTTVLGSRPTLLTPQSETLVSVAVQVVEEKPKRPLKDQSMGEIKRRR